MKTSWVLLAMGFTLFTLAALLLIQANETFIALGEPAKMFFFGTSLLFLSGWAKKILSGWAMKSRASKKNLKQRPVAPIAPVEIHGVTGQ